MYLLVGYKFFFFVSFLFLMLLRKVVLDKDKFLFLFERLNFVVFSVYLGVLDWNYVRNMRRLIL